MSSPPELYTMAPLSPTPLSPVPTYAHPSPLLPPSATLPISASDQTVKVPRPVNAFILFRSNFHKTKQIPLNEECRQQTISCVVGECWNMLSPHEKAMWQRKAEEAKRAHAAMHPGYKYSPSPRGTKATKKMKGTKPRDEAATRKKEERTRKLREEFTPFKGEAVPSQRKTKQLARSVRGTERTTRSRKAPASTKASTSNSVASPNPTSSSSFTTSSQPASAAATTSTVLAPLTMPTPRGAFIPSSTRLTPAPSIGPQITHITQSPPLTPFHPIDRQPQLQLPDITLRNPSDAQWGFHQGHESWMGSGMGEIALSQGNVYPAMGGSNASAYFEPRGSGVYAPMPVSDVDYSRSRSHSLDSSTGGMNMYRNNYVDYSNFSMADGLNGFTGDYRDAPETPYDLSDTPYFSPAAPLSSPAWSCYPQTPSSYSSPQPQTPLTLTLAAHYHDYNYGHSHDRELLDLNDRDALTQRQAETLQVYERKFGAGSLGSGQAGCADAGCFDAPAASYAANGAHNYGIGAWGKEIGTGEFEVEFGPVLHF